MTPEQNVQFLQFISTSIQMCRDQITQSATESKDCDWALEQITAGKARLRLVTEFSPVPSVTAEVIREEDGESLGQLFAIQARAPATEH